MLEPRGHADMYGCVLTRPVTEDGDVGVLFLHNEGYSTMCEARRPSRSGGFWPGCTGAMRERELLPGEEHG